MGGGRGALYMELKRAIKAILGSSHFHIHPPPSATAIWQYDEVGLLTLESMSKYLLGTLSEFIESFSDPIVL